MFRRNNKTRKYQAPTALVTQMVLERNFCQSVMFKIMMDVDPLENMMDPENADYQGEYYEDIVS